MWVSKLLSLAKPVGMDLAFSNAATGVVLVALKLLCGCNHNHN